MRNVWFGFRLDFRIGVPVSFRSIRTSPRVPIYKPTTLTYFLKPLISLENTKFSPAPCTSIIVHHQHFEAFARHHAAVYDHPASDHRAIFRVRLHRSHEACGRAWGDGKGRAACRDEAG